MLIEISGFLKIHIGKISLVLLTTIQEFQMAKGQDKGRDSEKNKGKKKLTIQEKQARKKEKQKTK